MSAIVSGLKGVNALVAALLAIVVSSLAIYTQWPRGKTTESATLAASVKPGLTLGDFVRENCVAASCGYVAPAMRRLPIVSVSARLTQLTGYKNENLLVVWQTETAGGATVGGSKKRTIKASLENDEQTLEPQWLPLPSRPGRFTTEVTLRDAATGLKLAAACTPVFKVSRGRGGRFQGSGGTGSAYPC